MVAIEHRQKASSSTATITATINATVLSPTSSSTSSSSTSTSTTTTSSVHQQQQIKDTDSKMSSSLQKQQESLEETGDIDAVTAAAATAGAVSKSAVSQRNVDIKIAKKSNKDAATKELTKKVLKLDLTGKQLDEYSLKSPKSPITARLPHQTSLTSSVDMEDRKSLRGALYNGIFNRHRRTIFAFGSFLRMLRSRNSQYNTIRSSSEGEQNRSSTKTLNEHDTKQDIDPDESSQEVIQQKIQMSSALSEKE